MYLDTGVGEGRKGSDGPSLFGSLSSQRKDEVQRVIPAGW